jgi:hypothetical protein
MYLNINSDAVVAFTNKLEKLHRSALPVSVRAGLNAAAFDVKKRTMPKTAKVFTQRSPTFFKSQSKVAPAKGFDIKTMQSEVGFIPSTGAKESGGATKDLEQQEKGGQIAKRAFIPLAAARAGGSYNRNVSAKNRMKLIRAKIRNAKNSAGKTNAAKFFSTAKFVGKGGVMIGSGKTGSKYLYRINSITRKNGKTVVNSTPLYSVKKNRAVKIKQTKFMQRASLESSKLVEQAYIVEAQKQIAKLK